jgi:tetratricopeptide (TPR) repeat protein
MAFADRRSLAPAWARMILQAGRETDTPDIVRRGTDLVEAVDYTAMIGLLVDDRFVPPSARALAHAERGVLLRAARHFDAALADFEAAVSLSRNDLRYVAERGETFRRMGRPADALPDLDRAIAADPDFTWALGCRGAALQALDRLPESLVDFDRALAQNPRYTWALGARAETLRRMHRFPEALESADRAIEILPDYVYGLYCRGEVLFAMRDLDRAAADLTRVVELDDGSCWSFYLLALIAHLRGEGTRTDLLAAAIDRTDRPGAANVLLRGLCLWALGREAEALDAVRAALAAGHPASGAAGQFRRLQKVTGQDIDPVLALLD